MDAVAAVVPVNPRSNATPATSASLQVVRPIVPARIVVLMDVVAAVDSARSLKTAMSRDTVSPLLVVAVETSPMRALVPTTAKPSNGARMEPSNNRTAWRMAPTLSAPGWRLMNTIGA